MNCPPIIGPGSGVQVSSICPAKYRTHKNVLVHLSKRWGGERVGGRAWQCGTTPFGQKYALDGIPGAIATDPYSSTGGQPFAAGGLNRAPGAGKKGMLGVGL
jgi:hypothetical protein